MGRAKPDKNRKGLCSKAELAGVAALSIASALLLMGAGVKTGIAHAVDSHILPAGTYVDSVYVGGLSVDEAYEKAVLSRRFDMENFHVTIKGEGVSRVWQWDELGLECDIMGVIEQAAYTGEGISLMDIGQLAGEQQPQRYITTAGINQDKLKSLILDAADHIDREPANATADFDKNTETFAFNEAAPGRRLDSGAVEEDILSRFDPIELTPIEIDLSQYILPVEADISLDELRENCTLISECVTKTTSNEDRNVNIQLMCQAADGICLQPGEQLSLNDLVGQRTEAKGFRYSDAIIDGKIESDMGGGICQMAGTLYNAALMADIEIVERVRHTYPSTYLPIGLDATLNWNNKDLVIANNTEYPLYISTRFEDKTVTARIYGRPLDDGMTIRLRSEVINKTKPGNEELIFTTDLPAGERKVKQTALSGYEVVVYKEYWKDETMLYDKRVSHDYYQPRNAIILEGSGTDK